MTAALAPRFVLTDDELRVITNRVGVQSLPVVLSLRPRHHTETALAAASDHATATLSERGLIHDGEVDPGLARVLRGLQRPARELAMRLVTPDGIARVAVVRHGVQCISATQVRHEITVEAVDGEASLPAAARVLLRHLPSAQTAEIESVGAPMDAVSEALSGTHHAALLSDRIRAFGADARSAMLLGSALASRRAFAEIVHYTMDRFEDRISRCRGAVGVFYTKRGRIVAAPSASPAGQLWTTLKAGSDHTIGQAIGQLVELSGERWGDD